MALTWKRGLPFQHGGAVLEGAAASRPAAAAASDTIYFASDTGVASYSDGATWSVVPYSDVSGSAVKSLDGGGGALTGDVILAAGTNVTLGQAGQTVTINSTGGGGGGALLKLFDSTLGADTASIDTGAGGIAATADTIEVFFVGRTTEVAVFSTVTVTLNNDTGANYDEVIMRNNNATVSGTNLRGQTNWLITCAGASGAVGIASVIRMQFPAYLQTTFHKVGEGTDVIPDATAANNHVASYGWRYRSTTAISRLAIAAGSGNLLAGSRLVIYGK